MTKLIIPDSNIFIKLLHPEHDSEEVKVFFKTCAELNTKLIVPELFKYEISAVACSFKCDLKKTLDLYYMHTRAIMTVSTPNEETWLLAEKITQAGSQQSGFPSLYDSIYHALAINLNGVFLTADKKHYDKAKEFGHIALLEVWESIFTIHLP